MDGTFVNQVKQCIEEKLRGGGKMKSDLSFIRLVILECG